MVPPNWLFFAFLVDGSRALWLNNVHVDKMQSCQLKVLNYLQHEGAEHLNWEELKEVVQHLQNSMEKFNIRSVIHAYSKEKPSAVESLVKKLKEKIIHKFGDNVLSGKLPKKLSIRSPHREGFIQL